MKKAGSREGSLIDTTHKPFERTYAIKQPKLLERTNMTSLPAALVVHMTYKIGRTLVSL